MTPIAVIGITHSMNDGPETVYYDFLFSPSLRAQPCAVFDGSRTVIHSCYLYYRIKKPTSFEYFFESS